MEQRHVDLVVQLACSDDSIRIPQSDLGWILEVQLLRCFQDELHCSLLLLADCDVENLDFI